ncbi:conserved protein of unknown function [Ectopseudomonas oleovorans]|uniref:Uncharacterized protein n=1 Tax=Ectopseudomonas oleovorans TaxID=301 RepID=A0A653AZW2_ECTOL|nr:conserved protein of unknown function [Pseudomonas oleovorans]
MLIPKHGCDISRYRLPCKPAKTALTQSFKIKTCSKTMS